jgi:argininosuccinate lyase
VAAAYAAESAHGTRLARGLSLADLAHAVALVEGGDLSGDEASSLLRGLLELHAIPGAEFPWDPALGDAFNAREADSNQPQLEVENSPGGTTDGTLVSDSKI